MNRDIHPTGYATSTNSPFYVVAGVCLDAEIYPQACPDLREDTRLLEVPGLEFPLGQGSEIKARDVARGTGWWGNNNGERNQFRDLMLTFPLKIVEPLFSSLSTKRVTGINTRGPRIRSLWRWAWPDPGKVDG
jgi:hypothetical protein